MNCEEAYEYTMTLNFLSCERTDTVYGYGATEPSRAALHKRYGNEFFRKSLFFWLMSDCSAFDKMEDMSSSLQLDWLGAPRIALDGRGLALETRKATALLAYLSLSPQGVRRETLSAMLWPEYDGERASGNLRRVLWSLNRTLGPEWLDPDNEQVRFLQGKGGIVDVLRFRELAGAHTGVGHPPCPDCLSALEEAAALYRGPFLEGLTLRDSPDFDEWQYFQGEELRSQLAAVLERLQILQADAGRLEDALASARRWVALDRLHEPAQRALMSLYDRAGQRSAALRQFDELKRQLAAELGAVPQPETVALGEAIRAGRPATQQAAAPEVVAAPAPAALPRPATAFIGRRSELVEIASLLAAPDVRLISLVGPGGIGKTRLALQAATFNGGRFDHGVCFVPLAPLTSAQFILQALAKALGLPNSDQVDLNQQIGTYLANKKMLLVMDNFEHLLDGAPLLDDLLQRAPGLKILATSRERLNLEGEWVIEIFGLSFPWDEREKDLEGYSAVQLFLSSARRVSSRFTLADADRPALVRICRRLEGMPLGVELAAGWVRALSCQEIAAEIERDLDFLTSPRRDAPEGHRSLRAVFERSWKLLNAAEREILSRISIFRGGFSRDAAFTIAGADPGMLAQLVDHSLLQRAPSSGRFGIHELLRQYAAEKLAENPVEELLTRQRYTRYYSAFVARLKDDLTGPCQRSACEAILSELDNVRSAWRYAVEDRDWQVLNEMGLNLYWFYAIKMYVAEAQKAFLLAIHALQTADGSAGDLTDEQRAILCTFMVAYFSSCNWGHDYDQAGRVAEEVNKLAKTLTDPVTMALVEVSSLPTFYMEIPIEMERDLLHDLEVLQANQIEWMIALCYRTLSVFYTTYGQAERARYYLQEQLALVRKRGNLYLMAGALRDLGGFCQVMGEYGEAARNYSAAIQASRELDDRFGVSVALDQLGYVQRRLGNFAEAERLHQESLAFSLELNEAMGIAGSYDDLGMVYRATGQLKRAREFYEKALHIRREVGNEYCICITQQNLGELDIDEGDGASARPRLLEAQEIAERLMFWETTSRGKNLLGRLALLEGDLDTAEKCLTEAQQNQMATYSGSELPQILLTLAELRAAQGRNAEALALVEAQLANPALWAENRPRAERLRARLKAV